jgi:hypothetical protein
MLHSGEHYFRSISSSVSKPSMTPPKSPSSSLD